MSHITIVYRAVADLKPDPKNPRLHAKSQIRRIARSIRTFGFNVPILVDQHDRVIAGHGRVLAAKEIGMKEMPTIRLEHLSEAQVRAFMIADNRLTEISTWDDKLLAEQLKELSVANIDFEIEATGFDMGEIDFRIQALEAADAEVDEPDPDDELPAAFELQIVKPGDLWQLDRHRIYCGNALEESSFKTLMDGKLATMVFTDPPYNVRIEGNVSGLGRVKHGEFAMASGEMSEEEFTTFLTRAFKNLASYSNAGSIHFLCTDWRHLIEYLAAGKVAFTELKNVCVWVKDNGGMGSMYRSQHELILVYKSESAPHRNNVLLGKFGRNRTNVWRYPGMSSWSRSTEEGNLLALHPTVKPVALVADAILDCSARGDVVLDPFLGSGTTVIAAERTGRAAYAIELDPRYVDVAIRRWQAHTGQEAKHAGSGCSFSDLEMALEEQEKRHD